jgi:glycosyltransferase involved in cell wall biosynthesis
VVCLDRLPWAVVAKRLRPGIRFIYDSNEEYDSFMLIKDWLPRPVRRPLQVLVRSLEPWLAGRLDATTTALPATHKRFTAAGVNSTLVRNFPPASIVPEGGRTAAFTHDVLVGGTLADDQIDLIARTAERLAELNGAPVRWLVVARDAEARERERLEDSLTRAGVRDSFQLRYDLPFVAMKGVLHSTRLGFIPYPGDVNYADRIPIRIFEYMATGIPFVAGDLPTTSAFLRGQGVAELVPAGNPDAAAGALHTLLRDPAAQSSMSDRGPRLVRAHYTWERESRYLVDLYAGLLPLSASARTSA